MKITPKFGDRVIIRKGGGGGGGGEDKKCILRNFNYMWSLNK